MELIFIAFKLFYLFIFQISVIFFQTSGSADQRDVQPFGVAVQELRPALLSYRHDCLLAASGLALQDEEEREGKRKEGTKPELVL